MYYYIFQFIILCLVVGGLGTYVFVYIVHGRPVYCQSTARLDDKTVLITGGTSGIGLETAVELARRGARVIIASRSWQRGDRAVRRIIDESNNRNVSWEYVDLGDWRTVHELSTRIHNNESQLHILINNAGVATVDNERGKHGYDSVFTINYLGHFLLTYLLLDLLKLSAPSRIINISSVAHQFIYQPVDLSFKDTIGDVICSGLAGYDVSKYALALHAKELSKRLAGTRVTANFLHPGIVYTDIWRKTLDIFPRLIRIIFFILMRPLFLTAAQGAQTTVYCAVAEEMENISGKYLHQCHIVKPSSIVQDPNVAFQLWEMSKLLTGCTDNGITIKHVPCLVNDENCDVLDKDSPCKTLKQVINNNIERF